MAEKQTDIGKLLRQARAAERNNKPALAAKHYQSALEISKKNPGLWGLFSWNLLQAGELKEALAAAKKMRNLAMKPPTVLSLPSIPLLAISDLVIAEVHRAAGRKVYAEKYYRESLEAMPRAETYTLLGDFLASLDRHSEAKRCYRSAIELDSSYEEAHYNLALWYRDHGDYERAIRYFQKTLEINPMHSDAVVELVQILWKFRSAGFGKALEVAEKAFQLQPNHRDIQICLGLTYRLLKKRSEAEQIFREALQQNPEDADLQWCFAILLAKDFKQPKEAEAHFKKALSIAPENSAAYYHYGQFLLKQKRETEAQAQLEKAENLGYRVLESNDEPLPQPIPALNGR